MDALSTVLVPKYTTIILSTNHTTNPSTATGQHQQTQNKKEANLLLLDAWYMFALWEQRLESCAWTSIDSNIQKQNGWEYKKCQNADTGTSPN